MTDSRAKAAQALAEALQPAFNAVGLAESWGGDLDSEADVADALAALTPAGLHALVVFALEQHPEWLAEAIHPQGKSPTVDCCSGSTARSVHGEVEGERLHRQYHEQDAAKLLAALREQEVIA